MAFETRYDNMPSPMVSPWTRKEIEDYVPERLGFSLTSGAAAARGSKAVEIAAPARYPYGAPGANLEIAGEVEIDAAAQSPLPALKGFTAGLQDEPFDKSSTEIEEAATTDAAGAAEILPPIPNVAASRPLEAKIILRAGDVCAEPPASCDRKCRSTFSEHALKTNAEVSRNPGREWRLLFCCCRILR